MSLVCRAQFCIKFWPFIAKAIKSKGRQHARSILPLIIKGILLDSILVSPLYQNIASHHRLNMRTPSITAVVLLLQLHSSAAVPTPDTQDVGHAGTGMQESGNGFSEPQRSTSFHDDEHSQDFHGSQRRPNINRRIVPQCIPDGEGGCAESHEPSTDRRPFDLNMPGMAPATQGNSMERRVVLQPGMEPIDTPTQIGDLTLHIGRSDLESDE